MVGWPAPTSLSTVRTQLETLAEASKGKLKGCAGVLAALEAHTPPVARADTLSHGLAALRIKGVRAFALFYGPHNQQYMMPMSEEGGAWKVGQLAPIRLPARLPAPDLIVQAPHLTLGRRAECKE